MTELRENRTNPITPSPTTRRQILRIGICAAIGSAVGSASNWIGAQPAQPADIELLLPKFKSIRQRLHVRARALTDVRKLVRSNGFIYTIDVAQLLIYFAQAGELESYTALGAHAEKNLVCDNPQHPFLKGFVPWRWKQGEAPDASGTTEALRLARGLWLGAKAFNRAADAELALKILDGYGRHGTIDQGIWIIRNYYGFNTHSFASNSFLVDYDPDFIDEVASDRNDKTLAKLAADSYGVIKSAVAPSGLLYDIIQPEVATLYPELNLAAFSPNDVIQLSNCCTAAVAVAHGRPEIARKVLALGLNRLDDLRAYYFGRTGQPYNGKVASVNDYSILARLAMRLGAETSAATIAERAMNDWLWCADRADSIEFFTLTEVLLAMQALEGGRK
jgi:hypothetical protein